MSFGFTLYRAATRLIGLAAGGILGRRVRDGKEEAARLNERHARRLPPRPDGTLVWLHGASVGESQMLFGLGMRLLAARPDLILLYTSQTQTSARLLADMLPERAVHQYAPLDTPGRARRFIAHWKPDLCIFGEGEIWPNLIYEAKRSGAAMAMVNARMTAKSLKGWRRWRGLLRHTLGQFDIILAADAQTASGLSGLLQRTIPCPGNLKSALPPPPANAAELAALRDNFVSGRKCYVAASTHAGEEELFLEAMAASDAALIIAPRHPERAGEITDLLNARGLDFVQRSLGQSPMQETHTLLADTLGEMGLWYRLADAVYLGGGHLQSVGGHNPLEPVRLGVPVVTGPHTHNFKSVMHELTQAGHVRIAETSADIARRLTSMQRLSDAQIQLVLHEADAPMTTTLDALLPLLPKPEGAI